MKSEALRVQHGLFFFFFIVLFCPFCSFAAVVSMNFLCKIGR